MGNTNQASGATGKTTCAGINSHPSYIGVMNREKAEVMLRKKGGNHCFIRYCKEDHAYMISGIKDGVDITHIKITVDQDNLYILEGREEKFDFVSDLLVKYYEEEFDFGGMMGKCFPRCVNLWWLNNMIVYAGIHTDRFSMYSRYSNTIEV